MRRSRGAGTRVEPQERLRGRRERVAAARHPPQATARLASLSDIFPICPTFSLTAEPGPRFSYFQGLQTIESFRFGDGDDYKYEIFSEYSRLALSRNEKYKCKPFNTEGLESGK